MTNWTRREALGMMGATFIAEVNSVNASIFFGPEAPDSPRRIENDPEARRKQLYDLLGDLPDRQRPIQVRQVDEAERDGYLLETLELDLNGIEIVPAYFARPKDAKGPRPTILFNHSHGGGYDIGKKEFIEGRRYLQPKPYAQELVEHGWNGLCIDHWVFGDRSHTAEGDMFKSMLWQGRVLWGMMVFDSLRAVDYLVSRPDVDESRLGTLGISMGSTMAWWLAAFDTRITATVDIQSRSRAAPVPNPRCQARHGPCMLLLSPSFARFRSSSVTRWLGGSVARPPRNRRRVQEGPARARTGRRRPVHAGASPYRPARARTGWREPHGTAATRVGARYGHSTRARPRAWPRPRFAAASGPASR